MFSRFSSYDSQEYRRRSSARNALKKLLLYELDNDDNHLTSLLRQLNIETDPIKYNYKNSKSLSMFSSNQYNSSGQIRNNNLSTFDIYQYIHSKTYSSSDIQLNQKNQKNQSSFYLFPDYLQKIKSGNYNLSSEGLNNNHQNRHRFRHEKKKQKYLRSKKNTEANEMDDFHYRNRICVRQISCQNMFHRQMIMKKKLKNKKKYKKKMTKIFVGKGKKITKSRKYRISSTQFMSTSPSIASRSPIKNKPSILLSPGTQRSSRIHNSQVNVMTSRDSSTNSVGSTQLLPTIYNESKPDNTSKPLGSSSTTPSLVSHFSSADSPPVPFYLSTTIPRTNVSKIESSKSITPTNENVHHLFAELKACIRMLGDLLQKETKSHANKKTSRNKSKHLSPSFSSSLLPISTSNRLKSSKESVKNNDNLFCEDITVRRCHSFNNQNPRNCQKHIPVSFHDPYDQLKRCLLIYPRNRNINNNEGHYNFTANSLHQISSKFSQS